VVSYKELNTSNGLTANTIYNIYKAKNGLIYIAHSKGLSCFDGVQVRYLYNKSFPYSELTNIMENKDGSILAEGFNNILFSLNKNDSITKSTFFDSKYGYTPSSHTENLVYHIHLDSLAIYNSNTNTRRNKKLVKVSKIKIGSIIHYGNYKGEIIAIDSNANFESIGGGNFHMNDSNLFLIQANGNIQWYNRKSVINLPKEKNQRINFIQCIDNVVFISTSNAVYQFENNKVTTFLKDINATSVCKINDVFFVVSTLDKGIVLVKNKNNFQYNTGEQNISAINKDKNTILVGKQNGELHEITNNMTSIKKYNLNKLELIYNKDGTTLYGNTLLINKSKFAKVNVKDVCEYGKHMLLATNSGIFLLPTKNHVVDTTLFKPSVDIPFLLNYQYLMQHTSDIEYDSVRNILYVGNYSGLFEVRNGKDIRQMPEPYCVLKDMLMYENELYLFSKDKGVLQYKNGKYSRAFPHLKIPSFISSAKLFGKALWLKTEEGIFRILHDSLTKYSTALNVSPLSIDQIWADDSLLLYSSKNILYRLPLWNTNIASVHSFFVTSIHANGKPIQNNTELHNNQNNIDIHFSLLNYEQDENVFIAYSINGEDTFNLNYKERSIKLSQLQSGSYSIQLLLRKGIGYTPAEVIRFNIQAPFYFRWWFLLLCLVGLIATFYALYKYRVKRINKNFAEKEAKYLLEKELDQSILTSIRSQMNPHFLYNALNTIQSYVFMNDAQSAGIYISKFSDLTRTILKQSEKNTISIAEELQSLSLYLELEKMRFEDILHYEITCDKKIIKEEIQLPPLLLQPYVENAIKHGLFHKLENRQLKISFEQLHNSLEIKIDDNGIGRKKSAEINAGKAKMHQSFSMDANKKRINILQQYYPNIQFEIKDKVSKLGEPLGTTIVILLPLQYS
jgi:sensor histidine kinase YesM/ligand-binding sensor domain-containing protein